MKEKIIRKERKRRLANGKQNEKKNEEQKEDEVW